MANAIASLQAGWGAWFGFLRELPLDEETPRREVRARLGRFCDRHPDDPEHLETVLGCLSRGKHLIEAAVRWEAPVAGPRPDSDGTATDRGRGEQFRLVMAHGGLETFLEALMLLQDRTRREETIRAFLDRCSLPPYEPLDPPHRELTELLKWLSFEEGRQPLTAFLKLNPTDTVTLRTWLVEGTPVADWGGALKLARVLRNCTVHGSLSASKVCRWGLRPAFGALSENIGAITAAALHVLAK
jgi:hypothetical protein